MKEVLMSEKIIKEFLTKMSTQDNRATEFPYFYVIRDRIFREAPMNACDEIRFRYEENYYFSRDEIVEDLASYGLEENQLKRELSRIREVGIKFDWKASGMFLTESDAENHLKANQHHYSSEAHTYIEHAWRAPELKEFLLALFSYFEISIEES